VIPARKLTFKHLTGKAQCSAIRARVENDQYQTCEMAVALLQREPPRQRLTIADPGLELDGCHVRSIVQDPVPPTTIRTIRHRDLGAEAQSWPKEVAKRREHPGVGSISKRITSGKRPHRYIKADNCAHLRSREDVEPRSKAALDSTELSSRDPDGICNVNKRQARRETRRSKLLAETEEQPTAAAGATGGVRFGHWRIVTRAAYRPITGRSPADHRPINRAATIAA
jgi:hypothetical protein